MSTNYLQFSIHLHSYNTLTGEYTFSNYTEIPLLELLYLNFFFKYILFQLGPPTILSPENPFKI